MNKILRDDKILWIWLFSPCFWGVSYPHLHKIGRTRVSRFPDGAITARHNTGENRRYAYHIRNDSQTIRVSCNYGRNESEPVFQAAILDPQSKRLLSRGYAKYRCCCEIGDTAGVICIRVVSVTDMTRFPRKSSLLAASSGEIRRTGLCWCTFFYQDPFACQSFCMKIRLGYDNVPVRGGSTPCAYLCGRSSTGRC